MKADESCGSGHEDDVFRHRVPPSSRQSGCIAIRILDLPVPGIAAHLLEISLGPPIKQLTCQRRISPARAHIAHPSSDYTAWQLATSRTLERIAHFEDGNSPSGTEVDSHTAGFCPQIFHGRKMSNCQILNME